MLKVVKPSQAVFDYNNKVAIDNTVVMPEPPEDSDEFLSFREKKEREEEERQRKLREQVETESRIQREIEAGVERQMNERHMVINGERDRILEEAHNQAETIIAEAKTAAMHYLRQAENDNAIAAEKARKAGYTDGFASGKKESLAKCETYLKAAAGFLDEINSRKEAYYISNREEMKETVLELVKKITLQEIKTDPTIIEGIIAQAAKNFRNSDYVKISLANGEVAQKLRTDANFVKELIPFIPDIEIEVLNEAEDNTVILDNGSEIIDASVPTQLDFLREIVKNTNSQDR
mgnify:CR=1 FL=1